MALALVATLCTSDVADAMSEKPQLRIASTQEALSHVIARNILREAYKEAGIGIEFINLPWLRSLTRSNRGLYDGETARLSVIEQDYRNLVRVPVKLYDLDCYAYALAPIPHIQTWQDMSSLRIGLEHGVVLSAQATKGMNQHFASSVADLLMELRRGGTDIIVYIGLEDFRKPPFNLHRSPRLHGDSLYHYLHRSNAHLVPRLADAIQKLHDSGKIADMLKKHRNTD